MHPTQASADLFAAGYSCSQAVLRAFAVELGLDPDTAARLAATFGGGMSRSGGPCGAVTGALMALGLAHGYTDPTDKAAKEHAYATGRRFLEAFAAQYGATTCPELLGCDIRTPEGAQAAREADLFKTRCPELVRSAAQIAADLMAEQRSAAG